MKSASGLPSRIGDFPDANFGQINRQIFPFLEGDAVKFRRRIENAVDQDVVQLVVRLELRFIECVARLPNFLRIKIPVAGCEFEAAVLPD